MAVVDPLHWRQGEQVSVRYVNSDTVSLYDLALVVDYDNRGSTDHFILEITTLTPDSLTMTEQVEVWIDRSRPGSGRFQGLGGRHYGELRIPYRIAVRLRREGEYYFLLAPDRPLSGVRAIGLEFSKH